MFIQEPHLGMVKNKICFCKLLVNNRSLQMEMEVINQYCLNDSKYLLAFACCDT